jgi:uncharacterized repeat protein (TIGR01451 family)/CSLREA domain-containing protein
MHRERRQAGTVRVVALLAVGLIALVSPGGASAAVGTTFTVDTTDGTTDGVCGGASDCSLGDAIQAANANPGPDTVAFALPLPPYTIQVDSSSPLPDITDPVVIDGTTHPAWVAAPIVEVRGNASADLLTVRAGPSTVRGLVINRYATGIRIVGGSGHRISGNYIGTDVTGSIAVGGTVGIATFAPGTVIGGASPLDRNVIAGHSAQNVLIQGPGATVQGNYIGTDASGEVALGGGTGIETLHSSNHLIGGDGVDEGNLISGHSARGIQVGGVPSSGHRIVGNRVGTDKDGVEPLPNFDGIAVSGADTVVSNNLISANRDGGLEIDGCTIGDCLGVIVQGNLIGVDATGTKGLGNGDHGIATSGADGVLIGGPAAEDGNVIAANGGLGSQTSGGIMFFNSARRHRIQGNLIGLGIDGTPLGNNGPGIRCCGAFAESRDNVIGGTAPGEANVIAYNTREGVRVGAPPGATHASIVGNTIRSNGLLGIDLGGDGPTINDPMDVDEGSNGLQNAPVISSIGVSNGQTLAEVELDSTPNTTFRLEFFRNDVCDGSDGSPDRPAFGRHGEGQALIHVVEATTDGAGAWTDTVALPGATAPTEVITATATRFADTSGSLVGSTSEFSECLADLSVRKLDSPEPVAPGGQITYTIEVSNDGPAPANAVVVEDTLFALPVAPPAPSQGSCRFFERLLYCELGRIARDGSATISVLLRAPGVPGAVENTACVESELRDPDPTDNCATATTEVWEPAPSGTIVVRKVTDPAGAQEAFAFTSSYRPGFSLADGESSVSGPLAAGSGYSVSESVPDGWEQQSASCDDGSAVSDISLSAGETVTCTFVNARVNRPPGAVDDSLTTSEDTPGNVGVLGNDSDPDGDALSTTGWTQGAHGSVSCTAAGACTYTPAANYSGPDSFSYTVSDGHGGSDTATVNVTVTPVNDPPDAVDDVLATAANTPGSVQVLSNDTDADGDALTVTAWSQGIAGSVACTAAGVCAYTPNVGFSGSDAFTYTVSDGKGGTDTATVNVTVAGDVAPPSCAIVAQGKDAAGKAFIRFRVQDAGSGLASWRTVGYFNAVLVVDPFAVGSTEPVFATGTAKKAGGSLAVTIEFRDVAGNTVICDPIATIVSREDDQPEDQTFTGVPHSDRYVTIVNGNPGMRKVRLTVNGTKFKERDLANGETRSFDIASALKPGNTNTITVTARGKQGASAFIIIADIPPNSG